MSDRYYYSLLNHTKRALQDQDLKKAKKLAENLVTLFPEKLEGWLILAGLSPPEKSIPLLKKAQSISPGDAWVHKALDWARKSIAIDKPDPRKAPQFVQSIDPIAKEPDKPPSTPPLKKTRIWWLALVFVLILAFVIFGASILSNLFTPKLAGIGLTELEINSETPTTTATNEIVTQITSDNTPTPILNQNPTDTPTPSPSPTITPLPPGPNLYGCDMTITFSTGPLAEKGVSFSMLDESYFEDKADKFNVGKNTAVYYRDHRLILLHTGYLNADISQPLEAEFIRFFLESWGDEEPEYIEEKIQALKGSEMIWLCKGQKALRLRLEEIVRMSHPASLRLGLEPHNVPQILADREGPEHEWIGDISADTNNSLLLNICGWGPPTVSPDQRSIYYRYLLRFEIIS